jgi:hypothetical protein
MQTCTIINNIIRNEPFLGYISAWTSLPAGLFDGLSSRQSIIRTTMEILVDLPKKKMLILNLSFEID